jgi:hypothetical protein
MQAIKTNKPNTNTDTLTFKPVTPTFVDKQINKLNIKKATGLKGMKMVFKERRELIKNCSLKYF